MSYGEACYGEASYGAVRAPVQPSPIPKQQAEQLRQLRGELPPKLFTRWEAALNAFADSLEGRGRKPKGNIAISFIKEKMAAGRPLTPKLKNEAARHAGCSRRTVDEWLQKDSGKLISASGY